VTRIVLTQATNSHTSKFSNINSHKYENSSLILLQIRQYFQSRKFPFPSFRSINTRQPDVAMNTRRRFMQKLDRPLNISTPNTSITYTYRKQSPSQDIIIQSPTFRIPTQRHNSLRRNKYHRIRLHCQSTIFKGITSYDSINLIIPGCRNVRNFFTAFRARGTRDR
jgi:hypothetical protein